MKMIHRYGPLCVLTVLALFSCHSVAWADFITGFEQPTYTSGTVVGQDSWTGGTAPRVQTATEIATELTAAGLNAAAPVHGGSQALIVTGTGSSSSTVRVVSGLQTSSKAVLDVWARPLSPGASGSTVGASVGNIFMVMEDVDGTRAAAFRFGATLDTNMQLATTSIDVFTASSNSWIPTGATWQPDTWYNLRLDADFVAKTYDAYVNGALVQNDVVFYNTSATELSQVRIFRGGGQAGMIVDDLIVVPEPSAFAVLAMAGCMVALGRRKLASRA